MFDTIISGGTVVDGTGAAERRADVGIRSGRIVAIEPSLAGAETRDMIDASGRIVTPGFVDVHTHYDGQVTWDDQLAPTSHHGVTTLMMGNCGVGFAPVRPTDHEALIDLMEGVEDIPGAALAEGISWGWESFPEYLEVIEQRRWSVDVGTQLAHGPLRTYVMGAEAAENIAASPDQVAEMGRLARAAAEAGAFGFTTSRTLGHRALDGRPVPGTYASVEELVGIATGFRRGGGRIVEFAAAGLARHDDPDQVTAEFEWIAQVAERTGLPASFILQQCHDAPDRWRHEMDRARTWRSQGLPVTPLIAGRPFGVIYGWDVRHPFQARPAYRALAHLPLAERLDRLREPGIRSAILSEADQPVDRAEERQIGYISRMLPESFILSEEPDYEQPPEQMLGALAERDGVTIEAATYDRLLEPGAMILFLLYGYAERNHDALHEQLLDPDAVVGLADGGAHVAFICDASIPTYLLTHWTRDRSRGPRLPLPEIVRRLTSQPAELYGLRDRGRLEPGLRADLNVIDHAALHLPPPRAVHDLPVGGVRLLQPPRGYDVTMVAGEVTRRNDADTGARPGRLLRSS